MIGAALIAKKALEVDSHGEEMNVVLELLTRHLRTCTSSLIGLTEVVSIVFVEVAVLSSSDSLHTTGRISFRSTGVLVEADISSDSEPGYRK